MESEWRLYLKEHAPELYEEMLADVKWAAEWRDKKIDKLELNLKRLTVTLPSLIRNTPHSCQTEEHCCALHAAHAAAAEAVEKVIKRVIED